MIDLIISFWDLFVNIGSSFINVISDCGHVFISFVTLFIENFNLIFSCLSSLPAPITFLISGFFQCLIVVFVVKIAILLRQNS